MIREFLYDIYLGSPTYNPIETLTYAFLLVAGIYFIYKKILPRLKVRIDTKFMLAFVPFMVFGGLARSAADVLLHPSFPVTIPDYIKFFIVTPGIYFAVIFLSMLILGASLLIQKRYDIGYHKTMIWTGSVLSAAVLAWLAQYITNFRGMAIVVLILATWSVILFPAIKTKYLTKMNYTILMSHMLDASATFTALQFHAGLGEKHFLPNLLIFDAALGPWVMFALKLAIVWPVLYYIDKTADKEYRTWLKMAVLLLGLSLGVRDIIAIGIFGQPLV